jgi:hypothetical protein
VEHDRGVLSSLDDLVQVADGTFPDRSGERPVHPNGLSTAQKEPPNEVSSRQVVMTGHRDQRATEVIRHGLDETSLTAPSRAFQHDRELLLKGGSEDLHLAPERQIEGSDLVVHVALLSIDKRSVARVTRSDRLRWTSAVPSAARNKGAITPAM